jgi:hypothetical protein
MRGLGGETSEKRLFVDGNMMQPSIEQPTIEMKRISWHEIFRATPVTEVTVLTLSA